MKLFSQRLITFFFLALCSGIFIAHSNAQSSEPYRLPLPEVEVLPNGLQIAWFLNDTLPVLDLNLLVKSGSREDPTGKTGVGVLLASLLDRGNAGMSERQVSHAVESLGASRYVLPDDDSVSIGIHGLAPDADTLLNLFSKIVLNPDFPKVEIDRQKIRLLESWTHLSESGTSLADYVFRKGLLNGTVYSRGGVGNSKELKSISRSDLINFHRNHFVPENSILMVIGRVNKQDFRRRILKSFGAWIGQAPDRVRTKVVDSRFIFKDREIVLVDRPGLSQAEIRVGFRSPLIASPDHYALAVGSALLGEVFNSRLNSLIRDELGLTYSISSAFSFKTDLGLFSISTATRNEAAGEVIGQTLKVLKKFRTDVLKLDEVEGAKEYLVGGFPLGVSTPTAVATRWSAGQLFGLGPNYLNEFVPGVRSVRSSEVTLAFQRNFDMDRALIVIAGDAKQIEKSLRAAGFKFFKKVSTVGLF